jgi:hypothetical protein
VKVNLEKKKRKKKKEKKKGQHGDVRRSLQAFFSDLQMPEDEGTMFLSNVTNQLSSDMASYPRRSPHP